MAVWLEMDRQRARKLMTSWVPAARQSGRLQPGPDVRPIGLCRGRPTSWDHDDQWDHFSLTRQPGRMIDAAEEFERLLRGTEPD